MATTAAADDEELARVIGVLAFHVQYNNIIQYVIGSISLVISLVLVRIVWAWTPDEMRQRKANLTMQLGGCTIHSLLFALSQPIPIFTHKVIIFTGPLREVGSITGAILYIMWWAGNILFRVANNMASLATGALTAALTHYLDMTHGLKQTNAVFEWYRTQSQPVRTAVIIAAQLLTTLVTTLPLVFSIDFSMEQHTGATAAMLAQRFSLIEMKSTHGALEAIGVLMLIYFGGYLYCVFRFGCTVWRQVEKMRESISPKTYKLLYRMSGVMFYSLFVPAIFFFLPTVIFVVFTFLIGQLFLPDRWLIALTTVVEVLYTLYPLALYAIVLVNFKQYRHIFLGCLKNPLPFFGVKQLRHKTTAPYTTHTSGST